MNDELNILYPKTMSERERLFALHDQLCREAKQLMTKKNQDYGKLKDPFNNFRKRGALGILTRLEDKVDRIDSFVEKGFNAVASESVRDTVVDLINYAVLLYGFLEQEGVLDGEKEIGLVTPNPQQLAGVE